MVDSYDTEPTDDELAGRVREAVKALREAARACSDRGISGTILLFNNCALEEFIDLEVDSLWKSPPVERL